MTPTEIHAHAVRIQREISEIGLLDAADKLELFKKLKRIANDNIVLIRELAEAVIALDRKGKS